MFYIKHYKSGKDLDADYPTFDAAMEAAEEIRKGGQWSAFYGVTFQIFKTGSWSAWGEV